MWAILDTGRLGPARVTLPEEAPPRRSTVLNFSNAGQKATSSSTCRGRHVPREEFRVWTRIASVLC